MAEQNISFYTIPAAFALVMTSHAYSMWLAGTNYDLAHPRATEENAIKDPKMTKSLLERIKRSRAATANGFETLGLFAAGVVAANAAGVSVADVNKLSVSYLATRVAYNISYTFLGEMSSLAVLRTATWTGGLGCVMAMFVKAGNRVN